MATLLDDCYAYVWRYAVKLGRREAFIAAYGPGGEWAQFFSRSEGYLRTDLLADDEDPVCLITIDYFVDADSRAALVDAYRDEYEAIDRRWEDATDGETFIGLFKVHSKA